MKLGTVVKVSFLTGFLLGLAGAFLKIFHAPGADALMLAGLVLSLVFMVTAIYEVQTCKKAHRSEKTMWTVALLFFSTLAGIVYLLSGRKRVVDDAQ